MIDDLQRQKMTKY